MKKADDVTIRVFDNGNQPSPTHILDLLQYLWARIRQRLQALLNIVNVIAARHFVRVTVRIQPDSLLSDPKAQ